MITTINEYWQVLLKLSDLMDLNPPDGSPESAEMEKLVTMIEAWERENVKILPATIEQAAEFRREQEAP